MVYSRRKHLSDKDAVEVYEFAQEVVANQGATDTEKPRLYGTLVPGRVFFAAELRELEAQVREQGIPTCTPKERDDTA